MRANTSAADGLDNIYVGNKDGWDDGHFGAFLMRRIDPKMAAHVSDAKDEWQQRQQSKF